jgi:hypothetical protein
VSAHAPLSPSSSKYWLRCSARVILSATEPDRKTGASEAGTLRHTAAENIYLGRPHGATQEIVDEVSPYVAYLRSLPGTVLIECRVHVTEHCWGTADAIHIHDHELEVVDLKTGRVPVMPDDNTQLLTYAAGALRMLRGIIDENDLDYIRLTVHQFGSAKSVLVSVADVHRHFARIVAAQALYDAGAMIYDTTACEYCAASHRCPAKIAQFTSLPGDDQPMDRALPLAIEAERWARAVKERALNLLVDGGSIAGYTLGPGRPSYSWPEEVQAAIREKHHELLEVPSPAKLKLIDPEVHSLYLPFVEKTPGQPIIKQT